MPTDEVAEELVDSLRLGGASPRWFDRLFHHYLRRVWAVCSRRGFARADCEDLVQEIFLHVHQSAGTFRGKSGPELSAWILSIASNRCHRHLRFHGAGKRRRIEVSLEIVSESAGDGQEPTPAAELEPALARLIAEEEKARLAAAIEQLPEKQRRCMLLRFRDTLSYREIAALSSIRPGTVKAHIYQGTQRLKELLSRNDR